ncbi:hypothetical protein Nepgr_010804 [Nepenthes gracilis]|uniref:Protein DETOXIFICATION n=1 Tax=Nepenthes gracilis TaxID=150966 RepID=A0AAD3SDM1_NEPGR|nr:hypothetical protein Nepgr_010804 [Nepenthes gracilis]
MESPLIKREATLAVDGDYPPVKSMAEVRAVLWAESVKMWKIAAPIACNILCLYGTNSLTNIFAGHIGDVELSAVAISLSVFGALSFGFMLGMASALETLCGQAFGAGQLYMLGIYMQRSWIILCISCIVFLPIYLFATSIVKFLGQDDEIAELAGNFTILVIPQLFSLAIQFPTQKFLQAQGKVSVMAWIGFAALVLHVGMLWVFIFVCGWGLVGAAAAFNITTWGITAAQVVYVVGWCKDSWNGLSWSAFDEIWAFFRLSVASAVMICLEVWYMMCAIILTGHLDNALTAVGSLSICMNLNGYEAMLFIGVNAAISVRVSNELGLRHPRAAKYSVYVTVLQSLLIGMFSMIIVLIARDDFAAIFTDSKELQRAVSKLAWLLGLTMVLNSVQPVISGVAVGGGWQEQVAYINVGCYYIFGLPLGLFLGYKAHLGVAGIWGGMISGVALQTLILLVVLYKTNWNREVEQTAERMRRWGGRDIEVEDCI